MEGTETVGEDTSTVEAAERGDGGDTTEQVVFVIINIEWERKAK